jgi:hypothetical protein
MKVKLKIIENKRIFVYKSKARDFVLLCAAI